MAVNIAQPLSEARITQMLSVTMNDYRKDLYDQVNKFMVPYSLNSKESEETALLKLNKGASGQSWSVPIVKDKLDNVGYTDSLGTFSTNTTKDLFSSVHYFFPHALQGSETLDWDQVEANRGNATRIVDIVTQTAEALFKGHAIALQKAFYDVAGWNASTAPAAMRDQERIIPIQVLIEEYGLVGGHDPANEGSSFWKSVVREFDPATDDIADALDALFLDISSGELTDDDPDGGPDKGTGELPNVLLVDRKFRDIIRKWATEHQYETTPRKETQELNINSFEFNGVTVTFDPNAPAGTCLAINRDYLFAEVQNDLWFKDMSPADKNPGNHTRTKVLTTKVQNWTPKRNAHGKLVIPGVTARPTAPTVTP